MLRRAPSNVSMSLRAAARLAGRVGIAALPASLGLLWLAQRGPTERWWIELSRYLPYYWLLVPCVAAFVVSFWLGRVWVLGAVAALALLFTLTTGFEWNPGTDNADRVRLMTYNIKAENALRRGDGFAALGREVALRNPDILVMQDANGLLIDRAAPALSDGQLFGLPHLYALGQYVVASRFALRDCGPGQIGIGDESHRYLRCTVGVGGVDLSLVTAHFLSPRGGLRATRTEGLEGKSEWQQNFQGRLAQSRALASDLARLPRPLVVAGDLNAPEKSVVIQTLLATGLRDAFSAAGRGHGFTYGHTMRAGLSFLRIDHILASTDIGVADSFVGGSEASDHRPVVADLVLQR